jgi:hypothetical protein
MTTTKETTPATEAMTTMSAVANSRMIKDGPGLVDNYEDSKGKQDWSAAYTSDGDKEIGTPASVTVDWNV